MRGGVVKHGLYVKAADHPSRRDQRARAGLSQRAAMPWLEDSDHTSVSRLGGTGILSTTAVRRI